MIGGSLFRIGVGATPLAAAVDAASRLRHEPVSIRPHHLRHLDRRDGDEGHGCADLAYLRLPPRAAFQCAAELDVPRLLRLLHAADAASADDGAFALRRLFPLAGIHQHQRYHLCRYRPDHAEPGDELFLGGAAIVAEPWHHHRRASAGVFPGHPRHGADHARRFPLGVSRRGAGLGEFGARIHDACRPMPEFISPARAGKWRSKPRRRNRKRANLRARESPSPADKARRNPPGSPSA